MFSPRSNGIWKQQIEKIFCEIHDAIEFGKILSSTYRNHNGNDAVQDAIDIGRVTVFEANVTHANDFM